MSKPSENPQLHKKLWIMCKKRKKKKEIETRVSVLHPHVGVGVGKLAPLIRIGNKNMRGPLRKLSHRTLWVYVYVFKCGKESVQQMQFMPRCPLKPVFSENSC
jgi:hypothetical protein